MFKFHTAPDGITGMERKPDGAVIAMSKHLQWSVPSANLIRGCVSDAKAPGDDVESLALVLPELWQEGEAVIRRFCSRVDQSAIEAEIWLETGRIILILKERREMARLVLTCPALECAYFALPTSPDPFAEQ